MANNKLRGVVQKALSKKANVQNVFYGYLGNAENVVIVPGRPNYVYVTLSDGMITQAYNTLAPSILHLPVVCGYDNKQGGSNLLRILDIRNLPRIGKNEESYYSDNHHAAHEWLSASGGTDVVYVQLRQFMPLRPSVVTPFGIYVARDIQLINSQWQLVGDELLDLTLYVPEPSTSGSGGMEKFVLISMASTSGSLVVTDGTAVAIGSSTMASIPAAPSGNYPICAVRMYTYQEYIVESRVRTDLIDLRWNIFATSALNHNSLGGLQGGVAGQYYHLTSAEVNKLNAGISGSGVMNATSGSVVRHNSSGIVPGVYNQISFDGTGHGVSGSLVNLPVAKSPVPNYYLTGYDAISGSFSSGSVVSGGTSGSGGGSVYYGLNYVDQSGDIAGTNYGALSGSVNGLNAEFAVSQGQYLSGSLEVYRNGLLQIQGSGSSADWGETSSGSGVFTFITAPLSGDIITAIYKTTSGSPAKPLSHEPVDGNYLTGYDAISGSFSSGSVSGGVLNLSGLSDVAISGSQLDGQVLTWVSGSAKWIPKYNYRYDPDDPPESAYAENDEFFITSGSINPKWTVNSNNAADTNFTQWPSWIRLRFSGNQAFEIVEPFTSISGSTNFSITAHFSLAVQSNYLCAKLFVMDSDKANMAISVWEFSTNSKLQLGTYESSKYTWNRVYINFSTIAPVTNIYLHLQRTSNAWFPAISFDGLAFYRTATTYSKTFTPAYIQLRLGQEGATIPTICGVDWVRVNWLTM